MLVYCDTSFLAALFLPSDANHVAAKKIAVKFSQPIPYTLLLELEFTNTLHRAVGRKEITVSEHDAITRQIRQDEADGILARTSINQGTHYEKARLISKRHAATLGARAIDILHIAAAIILKADAMATFDKQQYKLAHTVGLKMK